MTFIETYKQLQNEDYLAELLTESVYTTMYLEDQEVPKEKVHEIVLSVLKEYKLKGSQFFSDKLAK